MNITPVTYVIQSNKNQKNNSSKKLPQNFKGSSILAASNEVSSFSSNLLHLLSLKLIKFIYKIKKTNFINQLKSSNINLQENIIKAEYLSDLTKEEEKDLSARMNLAEKRLALLQEDSPATSDMRYLQIKDKKLPFKDHTKDPEFLKVVDKCLCAKGSKQKRVKKIKNLLLNYMGYKNNAVKLKFLTKKDIDNNGEMLAGYDNFSNCIIINSETNLNNTELTNILYHELTHMDNLAKQIKKFGFENIMLNLCKKKLNNDIITKIIYKYAIKEMKHYPDTKEIDDDTAIQAYYKSKIIYGEFYNKAFYKDADISNNDEYIEILKDEDLSFVFKSGGNSPLNWAKSRYNYSLCPEECLAYDKNAELEYLLGTDSGYFASRLTDIRLFAKQAMKLAIEKSQKMFGHSDISKLNYEQYQKLDNKLRLQEVVYKYVTEYLLKMYEKGEDMPISREEFVRIYFNGNFDRIKYLNLKIFDGNNGNLMKDLINMYQNKGGNIDEAYKKAAKNIENEKN